ncbi:hypothetical protein [Vibrio fortis]|uniref:hypothetical protein n=1 Tax=Vibrio fortis TaxID=212667 RepID=UPI0036F2A37B
MMIESAAVPDREFIVVNLETTYVQKRLAIETFLLSNNEHKVVSDWLFPKL